MGWDHTIPPVLPPKCMDEKPDCDSVDDQTKHYPPRTVVIIIAALYLINFLLGLVRILM